MFTDMVGYIALGQRNEALLAIWKIEERKLGPIAYNYVAYVYMALGDTDKYFENLSKALEEHALAVLAVMYSPLLAKAREDPRYVELVAKMRRMSGLAE